MAWNEAVVTNSGLELLTRCVLGGSVEITSAVGGESVSPAVSLLAVKEIAAPNHVLHVAKIDRLENGVRVNVRAQNTGLSTGYRLRQIGIFAKTAGSEETPVLLALIQDKDGEEIPTEEENPEYLLEYDFVIPLSNAENISVSVTPHTFATLDDLEPMNSHIEDKGNPHGVTKAQVGLGNVPDVATNDQTPTYTVSDALAELVSGEKLGTVLGKLAKAVKELIAHLADNVRHVTASERANWNGKANGTHGHSASEISGLPASLPANGGNADTVDGLHASSFAAASHGHSASEISGLPTSLPANGGNADTVDGSHAWQMQTLNSAGDPHGPGIHLLFCRHDAFGDGRFGLITSGNMQTRCHYASAADNANNADTVDGYHASSFAAASHGHSAAEISGLPTSLPANGGNADTVDGSHAWQMQTLAADGGSHGANSHVLACKFNAFGDGRFGLVTNSDFPIRCHYASAADNADMLDGLHANSFAAASHGHAEASQSAAGFMSAADKTKLDKIVQYFTNNGQITF